MNTNSDNVSNDVQQRLAVTECTKTHVGIRSIKTISTGSQHADPEKDTLNMHHIAQYFMVHTTCTIFTNESVQ